MLLNILLIPQYGIVGAAVATCISAVAGFIITVYNSQIHYRVPYDWWRLILAVSILLGALTYSAVYFDEEAWGLNPVYKTFFVLLIGCFIILALLKWSEFYKFISRWLKESQSQV